ncbi:MAG TPA: cobalamin B12-binding domain-containing protein [Clostridiaceae bacterium]|nr:cobalamin B12-binding domain-containing protein [Clostridiaceae bacterium]
MRILEVNKIYGLIKPANDAHTIGLQSAAEHLTECGYQVVIANEEVQRALTHYSDASARGQIIDWLKRENINRLGISYRLDTFDAIRMFGYLYEEIKNNNLLQVQGGQLDIIFFGGLPPTCAALEKEFKGPIVCFRGGESVKETLMLMGVPEEIIPKYMLEVGKYDEKLQQFGKQIINSGNYARESDLVADHYHEFGTRQDTVLKRLTAVSDAKALVGRAPTSGIRPLIRAHAGPYSSDHERLDAVRECGVWAEQLASAGLLDILSLGTSQLSQSHFGENWDGMVNGGGVPVNSEADFNFLYEASRPMLIRTYAGTKNIPLLAKIYENTINICWHALSLWWFNKLDGRGPYDLYTNLREHIRTISWIAGTGKPFEANVSHHFAFRGSDDITYIAVSYLAAKLAKKLGIKTFILQNMLNTPRSTWGVQDLAKSRAMLKLVRSLADGNFQIILQPRAGLDFFKPDITEAKIQLAAVTCLMDDIEPHNYASPEIIHVVSYSEASRLATPEIINESVRITLHTLKKYRQARHEGLVDDMSTNDEVRIRETSLLRDTRTLIRALEEIIPDLYSAEGFYKAFVAGFFPVPYLWDKSTEFSHARGLKTKLSQGTTVVINENNDPMSIEQRILLGARNLTDAEYYLKQYHK